MKYISRLLGFILAACNVLAVIGLWTCAYSAFFNPIAHPFWACAGLAFPILLGLNLLFIVWWLIIYRYYVWISLVGLVVAFPALRTYFPLHFEDKEPPLVAVKVLSYNCEAFANDTPHTKDSPNPVLEYLAQSGADIICLQEFNFGRNITEKTVNSALKDYPYHRSFHVRTTGLAVYSKLPILSARVFDIPSEGNGAGLFRLKVYEDTLTLFNCHLESNKLKSEDKEVYLDMIKDPEKDKVKKGSKRLLAKLTDAVAKRAPQADSIAAYIRRHPDDMTVVCGDFNDTPLSYTHRVIAKHMTDAFEESGWGLGISYHENRFYFRIDHILVSEDFQTYQCRVDRSIDASDHYPIWCLIAPKNRKYVSYDPEE